MVFGSVAGSCSLYRCRDPRRNAMEMADQRGEREREAKHMTVSRVSAV